MYLYTYKAHTLDNDGDGSPVLKTVKLSTCKERKGLGCKSFLYSNAFDFKLSIASTDTYQTISVDGKSFTSLGD